MAEKTAEPVVFSIGSEKYEWAVKGFQIRYNKAAYHFDEKKLNELAHNAAGRQNILKFILETCPAYLQKVTASPAKEVKK